MDVLVTGLIFVATYALIATDRLDKTIAALLGGTSVVLIGIIHQEEAFAAIDLNVIFLLTGMMTLVAVLRRTGFFQWLAIKSVKLTDGRPVRLMVVLSIVTAVLSALLDNVTTVVLIAPMTLYIATVIRVSPIPFLMVEIMASNIGGAATLIGDPPNILIGSAAGYGFADFIIHMAPPAILIFVVFLLMQRFLFLRGVVVRDDVREAVLALDENEVLGDRRLLRTSLIVIGGTIAGFLVAEPLGLEAGTIALAGAAVLLLLSRVKVEEVLREVEWPTLFFFVGLFMLVEAVVQVGIVSAAAATLIDVTGGDQTITTLGLLWVSGIGSGIIDNIPYTATMIPVVRELAASGLAIEPLWWSLALGACLGGNLTIIGASANVVVANLSGQAGHPISFMSFLRLGAIVTVMSLLISTGYVYLRYLM